MVDEDMGHKSVIFSKPEKRRQLAAGAKNAFFTSRLIWVIFADFQSISHVSNKEFEPMHIFGEFLLISCALGIVYGLREHRLRQESIEICMRRQRIRSMLPRHCAKKHYSAMIDYPSSAINSALDSYTPPEVGWEIWTGSIVAILPIVWASYEFYKRIATQQQCLVCK